MLRLVNRIRAVAPIRPLQNTVQLIYMKIDKGSDGNGIFKHSKYARIFYGICILWLLKLCEITILYFVIHIYI